MDDNRLALLEYIVHNAPEDCSTVLGAVDIYGALPEGSSLSVEDIVPAVKELAINGLVELKYSDKSNVCVASTEKGILLVERERRKGIAAAIEDKSRSIKGIAAMSIACGFAGGALAVAIAVAIYFIVKAVAL